MAKVRSAADDTPPGGALAQRLLFRTLVALVWKALERSRLTLADRDDIAQNVALRAFLRRSTYRAERGNLEQWLSGIVRNEVRRFLRAQASQPAPGLGDAPVDPASEAPTPEETASLGDLADHVFAIVPAEERRVVILHDIEGHTLREVADIVGISPSTAHDRHQRGLTLLRAAAAEEKVHSLEPLVIILRNARERSATILRNARERSATILRNAHDADRWWVPGVCGGSGARREIGRPRFEGASASVFSSTVLARASFAPVARRIGPPRREDDGLRAEQALMEQVRAALALEEFLAAVKALPARADALPASRTP